MLRTAPLRSLRKLARTRRDCSLLPGLYIKQNFMSVKRLWVNYYVDNALLKKEHVSACYDARIPDTSVLPGVTSGSVSGADEVKSHGAACIVEVLFAPPRGRCMEIGSRWTGRRTKPLAGPAPKAGQSLLSRPLRLPHSATPGPRRCVARLYSSIRLC